MFGLEERLTIAITGYGQSDPNYSRKKVVKITEGNSLDNFWIGIFPQSVYDYKILRKNSFPANVKSISYRLPRDTIRPNPKETKETLEKIYKDILKTIKSLNIPSSNLNVIGTSLGGVVALRLANNIPLNKAVFVCPGADLSRCIRDGIATSPIFKEGLKQGYNFDYFKKELKEFNPVDNMNHLSKKTRILIHLGRWDKMIPFKEGLEIVSAFKKQGITPEVVKRNFYGHGFTILTFKNNQ